MPQTSTTMPVVRTRTFAADNVISMTPSRKTCTIIFLVCDTTEFLDNVLPVPKSCVNEVFKKLRKDCIYQSGRWVRIPVSDSVREDKCCKPFIDIANAISDAVKASAVFTGGRHVNGVWVDRHKKSPKSALPTAAREACPWQDSAVSALLQCSGGSCTTDLCCIVCSC
ncbi:hypothetical protein L208DRAFT_1410050 [Tricholoma matsutake]|nr:hypothetical protein L208DRAFT_1410050 [Tricholoma matsutake 945]